MSKNETPNNEIYITCDSDANVHNALEIWIKFTGSFSETEIEFINELNQFPIYLIQVDKIKKYLEIRQRMELHKALINYRNDECTEEEINKIINYIQNTSLRNLVDSRISEEEKKTASLIINELVMIDDLKKYIESKDNNYTELSIYDAYILFHAKEKLYNIEQIELSKEQGATKKLSLSRSSKKYLEKKEGFKSEPISDLLKSKLEEANERANENISINNSIYNQSNAHSKEHVLVKK